MAQRGRRELVSTGSGTGEVAGLSERAAGSGEDDADGDFLNTLLYSRSSSVSPFGVCICGKLSAVLLRDNLEESDGRRCTARDSAGDEGAKVGNLAGLPGLAPRICSLGGGKPVQVGVDGSLVLLLCLKETFT